MSVFEILSRARLLARKGEVLEAEKKYLQAIGLLEKEANERPSRETKAELWSTKAEYLNFRASFCTENETIDDARNRMMESIRLLLRTSKLSTEYEKHFAPALKSIVANAILVFGCILPEDDTHVYVECPIKLKNMGAGSFGFSIGAFSEKAGCTICGRDILTDPSCTHIVGQSYDGKMCEIAFSGFQLDHVSLTDHPLDPRCKITKLTIPKKEFYEGLPREQIELKERSKLPLVCHLCKEEGIEPSEINAETYFRIQHISSEQ